MRSDSKAARRTRLPVSWGALGAIVVGIMLAKWTWLLFAPRNMSIIAPDAVGRSDAAGSLFGTTSASGADEAAFTALRNVRLAGVFAGSPGFAVLELDGKKQVGVPLGGEIVHGVKLVEMAADHVVIAGDGIRQRIDLQWRRAAVVANPPPASQIDDVRRQFMGGVPH